MKSVEESVAAPTIWYRVARLLPAVVALLSVMAVPDGLVTINYVELAVSGLGLAGAAVYYARKRLHRSIELVFTLFWIWAPLQLPNLLLATPQGRQPLWDTSALLGLRFYMGFNTSAGNLLQVGFNVLPLVYFAWLHRLRIAENFNE
jgi:hypothetical protein